MDMDNCEFREALQILWNITGTEIPGYTENKETIEIKKNLYSLYKDATNYYKSALSKNPEVKKYLIDRGLTSEDIQKFHFGYADSWVSLYNYLKDKWYEDEQIGQSQIFLDIKSRKDKFIGRVIFPIQNLRGDFVAFAGRILWKWEPKYLNSPASDIYDKSSILYWLYDARNAVTKNDQIIITEGYMDTIALHRAGFLQTVAVSWTALTEKHITIIKRLTHKIYLCFDADKAGEQATKNSLEILKNKWLEIKIISLWSWKDPDEFLEGGWDFNKLIANALSPIAFLIKTNKYDLKSIDEKKKFIAEILDIIRNYSDAVEQDTYLKELAKISDTPVSIIYELFKATRRAKQDTQENPEKVQLSPEDTAIALIIDEPNLAWEIQSGIIFPQWISTKLQSALENPWKFLKKLDLSQREKYKALAMSYTSKWNSHEGQTAERATLILWLNRMYYKSLSEQYKSLMNSWDHDALVKYSELLQVAKKHNIK